MNQQWFSCLDTNFGLISLSNMATLNLGDMQMLKPLILLQPHPSRDSELLGPLGTDCMSL